MPLYDYRCPQCDTRFEARHNFSAPTPACPKCAYEAPKRIITTAPSIAGGMLTHPGDGRNASKEQLQSKWAEETPKLRKKLSDKLGEEAVNRLAPTLNMPPASSD
ncbi:MAG: zinc ribbon domain-containing protein [Armatimonadetes bacterium]|nr:zinc ribbon domain-containing protein [Anaerolineae bacterium]